jgi:two-component system, cell cycle response regulator
MRSERSTDAFRTLQARALELEQDADRDPVTGLPSGAWFDGRFGEWFGEARETRTPLTLMLADIDGLHAVNQAHGPGAGDKLISSVAACLRRCLRPRDLVARHPGAAFAILMPRAPATAGCVVAERLRAGVADAGHDVAAAHVLRVTISIGCITVERGGFAARQQLVDAAARALGSAKRDGGDRVVSLVDKTGESLDRPAPAV